MQNPKPPPPWWRRLLTELRPAPRWREVLRRAWSVRLIAASFGCQVVGIVLAVAGSVGVHETPWRAVALQVLGACFSLAAFVARLVYQRGLSDEG